jgi:hypothetical protein
MMLGPALPKWVKKIHALSKSSKTHQFGRNKPPRFKTVNVALHAISSKQVDVPQRCKISKWMRSLRQIVELKHKQVRHNQKCCSQQDLVEAPVLVEKIRHAAKEFKKDLGPTWQNCVLDPLEQSLHEAVSDLSHQNRSLRMPSFTNVENKTTSEFRHL